MPGMFAQAFKGQRATLISMIDVNVNFLDRLLDAGIINDNLIADILAERIPYNRGRCLFNYLERHCPDNYFQPFCDILATMREDAVELMRTKLQQLTDPGNALQNKPYNQSAAAAAVEKQTPGSSFTHHNLPELAALQIKEATVEASAIGNESEESSNGRFDELGSGCRIKVATNTFCSFSSDLEESLSDLIDADYGLLERLRDVLTDKQYQSLRHCKHRERNVELMKIVNQLPQDAFLEALRDTGQQHIVNFIEFRQSNKAGNENETCWPLTDKQRKILKSKEYQLAQLMEIDLLLPVLYSSKCITYVHRKYIESKGTEYDRNVCLFEIMLKRSQADYGSFIRALDETEQSHVAEILLKDGGVVAVRAVLAEPEIEDDVVANFDRLWKVASPEQRQQILNKLLGPDVTLVDIRKGSSVAVYFLCKTLPAVQRLDAMRKDGTLKSVVGEIFSTLLEGRRVEITELDFYESSYNTCLQFFQSGEGVYGECFFRNNPLSVPDVMERQLHFSSSINCLPWELLEIVLVKGVVLSFKHQMKISSDADSLAILTVSMVCRHWHYVLGSRQFIVRKIRRTLDRVCRPFRRRIVSCCECLPVTEEDGTLSHVRNVATLDYRVFVVCKDSSTVGVFDLKSFTRLYNLELKGFLENPSDIATCEKTQRIYISDARNNCVWGIDGSSLSSRSTAVDSADSSPAVQFINCGGYRPWTLSTSGRRQQLLVTGYSSNWWFVYDVNGKLLRHVKLSKKGGDNDVEWLCILHAVQSTADDCYVLCRVGRRHQVQHVEVAEYNTEGQRLRCYYSGPRGDDPRKVHYPLYMTSIGGGRLLVADSGGAGRVLLLNNELKLERTLLARQESKPERLCYDSKTGLLCEIMANGSVHQWRTQDFVLEGAHPPLPSCPPLSPSPPPVRLSLS